MNKDNLNTTKACNPIGAILLVMAIIFLSGAFISNFAFNAPFFITVLCFTIGGSCLFIGVIESINHE